MYRLYLALRYLLSRPINLLGVLGVSVSVWALIVVVSIFSGFLVEVQNHVRAVTSDLTVLGCRRLAEVEEVLAADPNVEAYAPRYAWFGLLHTLGKTRGAAPRVDSLEQPGADSPLISLIGIDPAAEGEVTEFGAWLRAAETGRVTDPAAPFGGGALPGIVVGERRLRADAASKGLPVTVHSGRETPDDARQPLEMFDAQFEITGTYATRHTAFDAQTCFVDIDALRQLMGVEPGDDVVTQVVLRCVDPDARDETAARLERTLNAARPPHAPMLRVFAWHQLEAHFLSAVEHQRALMKLVLIVILVVAAFLMYATLSMMVTEKTHDIGILTAMGATPWGVLRVFAGCGVAITLCGTVIGVIAGCISSIYLDAFNRWLRASFGLDLFPARIYNLERVPYDLDPVWIGQVVLMAMAVGLLVSALPAWRAARHDPLHSLRHE